MWLFVSSFLQDSRSLSYSLLSFKDIISYCVRPTQNNLSLEALQITFVVTESQESLSIIVTCDAHIHVQGILQRVYKKGQGSWGSS